MSGWVQQQQQQSVELESVENIKRFRPPLSLLFLYFWPFSTITVISQGFLYSSFKEKREREREDR
jgi:hypothetical protein